MAAGLLHSDEVTSANVTFLLYGFVTSDKTNRKKPNSVSNSLYIGSGNIG